MKASTEFDLATWIKTRFADELARLAPGPGTTTLTLPSGEVISLSDWSTGALYSAAEITASSSPPDRLGLFTYCESQTPVELGRVATRADTNLKKPGYGGLPSDYEALIYGVTARVVHHGGTPWSEEFLNWYRQSSVRFVYNDKVVFQAPLVALDHGEEVIDRMTGGLKAVRLSRKPYTDEEVVTVVPHFIEGVLPVHLRANLSYAVEVSAPLDVSEALVASLSPNPDPVIARAIDQLDVVANLAPVSIAKEIRDAIRPLKRSPAITLWIDLLGFFKRPVF